MKRRSGYNPKRQIAADDRLEAAAREDLAVRARYGGNPEHKWRPGDYGLTPPANPRPGKALCDGVRPIAKDEALSLLQSGLRRGTVSIARRDGWPQNVWAISALGEVFEAQLENAAQGVYHGYPMPADDDFRLVVIREWSARA